MNYYGNNSSHFSTAVDIASLDPLKLMWNAAKSGSALTSNLILFIFFKNSIILSAFVSLVTIGLMVSITAVVASGLLMTAV